MLKLLNLSISIPITASAFLAKSEYSAKRTDEHGDVGGVDGTEPKVGQRGGFPLELPIEVKALGRVAVELEFIRDFPIYDGDGGARVEDELQVGLGANAAVDLDEVTGGELEGEFAERHAVCRRGLRLSFGS